MKLRIVVWILMITNVSFAQEIDSLVFNQNENDTLIVEQNDSVIIKSISDSSFNNTQASTNDIKSISESDFDKLYLFNENVLVVNIKQITATEIKFKYPFNSMLMHVNREEINEIEYSYGTIEIINNQNTTDNTEAFSWKNINFIYNPSQTVGLVEVEKVFVRFDGNKLKESSDYLLRNAEIILAKKAFNAGANTILISNTYIHKAYGELPYVSLEGIAYTLKE